MRRNISFNLVLLGLLFLVPSASAYGDPASGGFLIQVLLAGALAGAAVLKGQLARVVEFVRVKRRAPQAQHIGRE